MQTRKHILCTLLFLTFLGQVGRERKLIVVKKSCTTHKIKSGESHGMSRALCWQRPWTMVALRCGTVSLDLLLWFLISFTADQEGGWKRTSVIKGDNA